MGTTVYGEEEGEVFLGRSVTTHKQVSEATMREVDGEIRNIIDTQYRKAKNLLEENRDKVEVMAKALLEWETLDEKQISEVMDGEEPTPPDDMPPPAVRKTRGGPKRKRKAPIIGDENAEAA